MAFYNIYSGYAGKYNINSILSQFAAVMIAKYPVQNFKKVMLHIMGNIGRNKATHMEVVSFNNVIYVIDRNSTHLIGNNPQIDSKIHKSYIRYGPRHFTLRSTSAWTYRTLRSTRRFCNHQKQRISGVIFFYITS